MQKKNILRISSCFVAAEFVVEVLVGAAVVLNLDAMVFHPDASGTEEDVQADHGARSVTLQRSFHLVCGCATVYTRRSAVSDISGAPPCSLGPAGSKSA